MIRSCREQTPSRRVRSVQLRARVLRAFSATVPAALFAVTETVSAAEALACRSA
jgi:hypothetical protein